MDIENVNVGDLNERAPLLDDTAKAKSDAKSPLLPGQVAQVDQVDDPSVIADSLPIELKAENPNILKTPGSSETPSAPPEQFNSFIDANTAQIYIGMRQLQLTTLLDLAVSSMKDAMDKTLTSAKMDLNAAEKQKEAKELEADQSTIAGISSAINGTISLGGAFYASTLSVEPGSDSVTEESEVTSTQPEVAKPDPTEAARSNQAKLQKAKLWIDGLQQTNTGIQQIITGSLKRQEANKSFSASEYKVMSDVVKRMEDQLKELFKQMDQFFDSIGADIMSAANTTAAVFQTMSRI